MNYLAAESVAGIDGSSSESRSGSCCGSSSSSNKSSGSGGEGDVCSSSSSSSSSSSCCCDGHGYDYDYVVVGAGPAGLQMAFFLQSAGLRYVVLESRPAAASFFERMPRHRRLISLNKRYNLFDEDEFNLRHDWNSLLADATPPPQPAQQPPPPPPQPAQQPPPLAQQQQQPVQRPRLRFGQYSDELYPAADTLVRYMNDYAAAHRLNVRYNCSVELIDRLCACGDDDAKQRVGFALRLRDGERIAARRLLMATGVVGEHLPPDVPGTELAETYDSHSTDSSVYTNKRVCVVGGGNAAFETASALVGSAAIVHMAVGSEVKFAWNTHYVGHLRAVNNAIIEMARMRSMHAVFGSKMTKIEKSANDGCLIVHFVDRNTNTEPPAWYSFSIEYDHVILCCGFKYLPLELFSERVRPDALKGGRYPQLNTSWETSVPDLYFIGTASAGGEMKKTSGGFIHGFRYNIRTCFNILMERHHDVPLTAISLGRDLESIAAKIVDRASTSDALYQMYGFLCDVVIIDSEGGAVYMPELPINYVLQREDLSANREHLFLFWLNYGFHRYNVEPIEDVHAPNLLQNECVPFLHTIVTYYHYGKQVADCHLHGSLVLRLDKKSASMFPQWPHKASMNYLMNFFNQQLKWVTTEFDMETLPPSLLAKIYTPLTEAEKRRIPTA